LLRHDGELDRHVVPFARNRVLKIRVRKIRVRKIQIRWFDYARA
jgi:hypothetical protein